MGTAEILIVFSALMALIALVTIGIDWIGKPLKHRRFIPRIYRFDDEKLPIDEYGNTTFDSEPQTQIPHSPIPHIQTPGQPAMPQPMVPSPSVAHAMVGPSTQLRGPAVISGANPTVVVPTQPAPRQVATIDAEIAATATASRSAFTDSLAGPAIAEPSSAEPAQSSADYGLIAGTATAATAAAMTTVSAEQAWTPAMALDTTIGDQKPSLAIKAERFWKATADAAQNSHFDADDIARMASGKAPRRTNPRTGRTEAMQLTGLRQASTRESVRMRWPDDSVDPWSAS